MEMWLLGVLCGWAFLLLTTVVCPFSGFVARTSFLLWPIFKLVPHSHVWRKLRSATDYGNAFSRHFGEYHGTDEKECALCGEVVRDEEQRVY
jgi:hypothetical protein